MKHLDTILLIIIILMGIWIIYRDLTSDARTTTLLNNVLSGYEFNAE